MSSRSLIFRKDIFLPAVCAGLLLSGCRDSHVQTAEFFVFGTIVEVAVADAEPETTEQAFGEIQAQLQAAHRNWHAWEPGMLTTINAAFAHGETAKADGDLVAMLRMSQEAETLSKGRFNPAIGRLIELWGFHTSDYPIFGPAPDAAEIAALVARAPSTHDIVIAGDQLSSANAAVQLDFGAIAEGYAVDRAFEVLKKLGIDNAIVNVGGDLRAMGSKGSHPWRVAIRDPFGNGKDGRSEGILGGIEIKGDEAVFTSGNYHRYRETADRRRYAHILDPHTGWPAEELVAVTLIATQGWKADAAATSLVVAGLSGWVEVAKAFGIDQVLVVDDQRGIYVTPAMLDRLEIEDPKEWTITVRELDD